MLQIQQIQVQNWKLLSTIPALDLWDSPASLIFQSFYTGASVQHKLREAKGNLSLKDSHNQVL